MNTAGNKIFGSTDQVEKFAIGTALNRNWTVAHKNIVVDVFCKTVILTGTVHSQLEFDAAEKIARDTGVVEVVVNNLLVE